MFSMCSASLLQAVLLLLGFFSLIPHIFALEVPSDYSTILSSSWMVKFSKSPKTQLIYHPYHYTCQSNQKLILLPQRHENCHCQQLTFALNSYRFIQVLSLHTCLSYIASSLKAGTVTISTYLIQFLPQRPKQLILVVLSRYSKSQVLSSLHEVAIKCDQLNLLYVTSNVHYVPGICSKHFNVLFLQSSHDSVKQIFFKITLELKILRHRSLKAFASVK